MKNIFSKIIQYKNYLLAILLLGTIIALTSNPTLLALKSSKNAPKKITTKQIQNRQPTINPTATPTPQSIKHPVLAAAIQLTATPKPISSIPTPIIPTDKPAQSTPNPTTQPTPTISVSIATNTITPSPTPNSQQVNLQIQLPTSTITTTLPLKSNTNVCDVLQEAKDQNKITSLTFDDSYLSMMHSRYVKEINGYQNNWTFTVNGASPLGCSLSTPQPNDTIVWKFD